MLKQGSVADVKNGVIPRDESYIVITMRFYPRFLKREFRDEFVCDLAPQKELLKEFNDAQRRLGNHNISFAEVDYEHRLYLSPAAVAHLRRLSELSVKKDVYLICICETGERCHREMLMLLAEQAFACRIGDVFHTYPIFMRRIPEFTA